MQGSELLCTKSMAGAPVYISNADVDRLVEWVDIVQGVYDALEQCSEGEKGGVVLPVRSDVPVAEQNG